MNYYLHHNELNCKGVHTKNVKRILVVVEEDKAYVGDSCKKFARLRICQLFFPNATIHINFRNTLHAGLYKAILKNNPFVEQVHTLEYDEINFAVYDVVICAMTDESKLAAALAHQYSNTNCFPTAVFSFSESVRRIENNKVDLSPALFPSYSAFLEGEDVEIDSRPDEMYISDEEREWANRWLEENGVRKDDKVFILVDATSNSNKFLRVDVYFAMLRWFMKKSNVRILIFDEMGQNKQEFYRMWLGDELCSRIIFSTKQLFRNDLSILASDYVKFIIGPCTGLLHCASDIFNHFVSKGMPRRNVPEIVVYTGSFNDFSGYLPNTWWGGSPLVSCLVLCNSNGKPAIRLLNEMSEEEKAREDILVSCKEYTLDLLFELFRQRFQHVLFDEAPQQLQPVYSAMR